MLVNREKYLSKIRPFYDLDIIKVLMGSRRSGKSKILELIINELLEKGINKKELARLTGRRPSDVTRWLGGGHNFTCRTIALIQHALGVSIIEICK